MTSLYREFPLTTPARWTSMVAFVKCNWQAFFDRGETLRVIVTSDSKKRSGEQNKYWNGVILKAITEQAWWDGKQYPAEFWREYFRRRFLLKDEFTLPTGEIMPTYWSTADKEFTVAMMSKYLNEVQAEAGQDLGVIFE